MQVCLCVSVLEAYHRGPGAEEQSRFLLHQTFVRLPHCLLHTQSPYLSVCIKPSIPYFPSPSSPPPPSPSLPTSVRDNHLKRLLQKYRPLIGHLNLRGCSQLTADSIRAISTTPVSLPFLLSSPFLPLHMYFPSCTGQCQNLQDLNLSECQGLSVSRHQNFLSHL